MAIKYTGDNKEDLTNYSEDQFGPYEDILSPHELIDICKELIKTSYYVKNKLLEAGLIKMIANSEEQKITDNDYLLFEWLLIAETWKQVCGNQQGNGKS